LEYDDQIENEDIDLLELIMSDSNASNQYLVFHGSNNEIYAINVSKVVEILVYKDLNMVKNGKGDSLIQATAQVRDNTATIINFDEWFGNKVLDDSDYEYLILAGFGGHNLGIMIKGVEYIVNIDSLNMQDNSKNNPKTNFISKIKINGEDRLCTIFDCDKLLIDIFKDIIGKNNIELINNDQVIKSNKTIFFADDSRFIRKLVESLLNKLQLKYKSFKNGQELLDDLKSTKPDDIALIITDLEMPIMDGFNLLKNLKELDEYCDINILVHTNMSNFIIENSLVDLGTVMVIGKINIEELSLGIRQYIR
jgi:two-component system chemotaxis response regulator CheV